MSLLNKKPKLELTPLPKHLKYIFLGEDDILPVIISVNLCIAQEEQVKSIIQKCKLAI